MKNSTIHEEVPPSVTLCEIAISFTLPMGKSLSRTFRRELRTQMVTRFRVAISAEKVTLSCSPPLFVDAQWPAKNMDLGVATYFFADSRVEVTVSSISGPTEGILDFSGEARKEVGVLMASAMAGTAAAVAGYDPFLDRAWGSTLEAIVENLRRQPSSGPTDVIAADFANPRLEVKLTLVEPFLYESQGSGLSMPAGAMFGVEVLGAGDLASILAAGSIAEKTEAARLESVTITSESIFVLVGGKPVAALDRVRLDRGGAVTLEEMRLMGVLGQAEGLEAMFRTIVSAVTLTDMGVPLPDAIAVVSTTPDALATIVPALARGKIEEALSEGARRLLRERARTIPGLDLCEVFGIAT